MTIVHCRRGLYDKSDAPHDIHFDFAISINPLAQQTGNELLTGCEFALAAMEQRRKNMTESGAYCGGYIRGVMDIITVSNQGYWDAGLPNAFSICIPDNATNGQVIRTVTKFLRESPEKLHEP